jgi:DNA polymerase III sliding clamp (beta) subunit (PCNA family)
MKLNRKNLNIILPQIKAHLNVAIMMDNFEYPGLIDFIFQPKSKETEFGYLNRLTCSMSNEDDLFTDSVVETLGEPLIIDIARLRDALRGGPFEPELKDGMVNGINIQVDVDNLRSISMGRYINSHWETIKDFNFSGGIKFTMPRVDYELIARTMSQFVSQDITRIFMCGYDIDFSKGEDFINFVATDGRKMAICKFPYKHPKIGNDEENGDNFIFNPLHLFIPESAYSRSEWWVSDYASIIRIQTENYSIDCWAKPIEGQFPNYLKVIPDREQNKEWMILNARSARLAFDSIKGLINNGGYSSSKNQVFIDAEDPKRIKLTVSGASVDIDGETSRPMCLRISWDHINPVFFDTPFTKFFLQNVNKAILVEETRAVRGTTMAITKIVMPIEHEDHVNEWGIAQVKTSIDNNSDEPDSEEFEDDHSSIEYGDSEKEFV